MHHNNCVRRMFITHIEQALELFVLRLHIKEGLAKIHFCLKKILKLMLPYKWERGSKFLRVFANVLCD